MPRPLPNTHRLACPVRGCGEPLAAGTGAGGERGVRCPRGHAFDPSRRGTLHLLQPHERRSRLPGDAPATVAARERLFSAGVDGALREAVARRVAALGLASDAGVLDVGAGVGGTLALLRAREPRPSVEHYGVDLSAAAVEAAARLTPRCQWIVANAARRLPFLDGSLDLVLSVKAPRPVAEMARVLAPGGRALVALPAPDDLIELRRATAGAGLARDPAERALAELGAAFAPLARDEVREEVALAPEVARDLLAVAYRGARHAERGRALALGPTRVTLSATLLVLERRAGAPAAPGSR